MEELKKKLENFLFYYKFHTIAAVFVIIVIILLIQSVSEKEKNYSFVAVDCTISLLGDDIEELKNGFSEYVSIDKELMNFTSSSNYVTDNKADNEIYQMAGVKGLSEKAYEGLIDFLFCYRDNGLGEKSVGSIKNVLPKDIYDKISDHIVYESIEQEDGTYELTENEIGIFISNSKNFKKIFGETDAKIMIQIPENSKNKELSIELLKYLFDM